MELKFTVSGQTLTGYAPSVVVSDTLGYLTAHVTFSADWARMDKWLHLRNEAGDTFEVELWEDRAAGLNLASGRWELWIHGHEMTDGVPACRITTNTVAFTVVRAGLVRDIFPDIPQSAEEQIAANAANALAEVRALRSDMKPLAQSIEKTEQYAQESGKAALRAEAGAAQATQAADRAQEQAGLAQAGGRLAAQAAQEAAAARDTVQTTALEVKSQAAEARRAAESAHDAQTVTQQARDTAVEANQQAQAAAQTTTTHSAAAVEASARAVQAETIAVAKAAESKSWAVGGTGTREDEAVNNAKYWSDRAKDAAGGGVVSFKGRNGAVEPMEGDYTPVQVGADPAGTAAAAVNAHDQNQGAHMELFARKADATALSAHENNHGNPHQVTAAQIHAHPDTWMPTAAQVGADPAGTAASAVNGHNASGDAHAALFAGKQNKLTGKVTDMVGFDASGNAIAAPITSLVPNPSMVGTYVGNQRTIGQEVWREFALPQKPIAVFVLGVHGWRFTYGRPEHFCSALAVTGGDVKWESYTFMELTETGFRLRSYRPSSSIIASYLNEEGEFYHYIAWF